MAGVAFAIGMTVDNTIVVLEAIVQAKRQGVSKIQAAIDGVKDVWPAVLASTATTVLVFAPILFVEQEAGQLYSDIAIAISGAIIASMLIAIFVVPVALAHLGKKSDLKTSKSFTLSDKWLAFAKRFTQTRQQAAVVVGIFVVSILGAAYLLMPAAEYLPEGEEPKAFSMMIAPPSYNLSEMKTIGAELREYFDDFIEADEKDFLAGNTNMPPLEYYSMSVSVGRIWFLSAPVDPSHINEMMNAITDKFRSYDKMRAFSARGSIISSNDGGTRAVAR